MDSNWVDDVGFEKWRLRAGTARAVAARAMTPQRMMMTVPSGMSVVCGPWPGWANAAVAVKSASEAAARRAVVTAFPLFEE